MNTTTISVLVKQATGSLKNVYFRERVILLLHDWKVPASKRRVTSDALRAILKLHKFGHFLARTYTSGKVNVQVMERLQ